MEYPMSAGGDPAIELETIPPGVLHAIAQLERPVNAYIYDPAVARRQAASLRAVLPAQADLFYAVKANSFEPVVDALASVVDGFEVASAAEVAQVAKAAARAGRPLRAVASGPGKHERLLRSLIEAGVEAINVESALELDRVAAIGRERGMPVPITLRVNPAHIALEGSLVMGGRSTPFGIPEEEIDEVLDTATRLSGVDVVGFHVHAVSGNLDARAHVAYVRWCLQWSTATAARAGVTLRIVDVGGGLGVAFGGGPEFDLGAFGEGLAGVDVPDGCRLILEPGRWLVADCGWYAAEVVDVKHRRGTTFAVVRGGINHFLLPATWDIVHRFAVVPFDGWPAGLGRPRADGTPVTVVGELCTPEDVLVRDVTVDRLRAGDVVVFPQAGSYGWEFALQRFLQHPVAERLTVRG